jgi:hypothetical protein
MFVRSLTVLIVFATLAIGQEKKDSRLKEFAPKGTKFKVLMPGVPVETDVRAQGMRTKSWRAEEDKQGYAIMVIDLPEQVAKDSRSPEQRLEGALTGGLWFTTVAKEEPKKLFLADKYPGLETTGTLKGDERLIKMRTYLIDNQIVHLISMGKPDFLGAEETTKFLESLQVGK